MAAPNQQPHPLQVLDQMFNEVLVQTAKHVRTSSKDGPRISGGASNAIRAKTADSLIAYHYALDDLESEITRAKAVVLRDLEKLRAARAPAPAPAPVPTPALQPVAPPAPMMELPSSAAHTMSAPAFAPKQEIKTAAPFPDMGMGMSNDVVDLTSNDKKPSPRVPSGAIRPPTKVTPTMRHEVKPSPKQTPKPAPRQNQLPHKVTPVPPPQIPRLQPPQPATLGPTVANQPQGAVRNSQPPKQPQAAPAAQTAQDTTLNAMLVPGNATGGETNAPGGNSGLNFTDMQFSLAPSNNETQGAPPAPMPEFDMTAFAPQDAGKDASKPNNASGQNTTATTSQQQQPPPPKEPEKADTNLDDLFNLDNNNGTDNMFDLGSGGVNDSTFDDMMFFNNDSDMGQFDENYFLQ
ncbi:hypothetical protein M426DRAFT_26849 [Hypoxylon sp. CI-4A]|nr:hypothetical protein M426DRAFT_26849 [Hypoxylon sp. CI-4A]